MTQLIKWGYLVVLAVWVGSIVFFSAVAAPMIFRTLSPENAGQVIRRIFPQYYLLGIGCATLGIVAVALLAAGQSLRPVVAVFSLLLLAGMGAADFWMRQTVAPRMDELRQQIAAAKAASRSPAAAVEQDWKALHRLSVQVNGAVLVSGLVLLGILVYSKGV